LRTELHTVRAAPGIRLRAIAAAGAFLLYGTGALAQVTVTLPDTSQTTAASVTVSEQARITVPTGVSFNVTDINNATAAPAAAVSIDRIVLTTATKQLRLSLRAASVSFSPPAGGGTTWTASDVSWTTGAWTGGLGSAGALSAAAFTPVATCSQGTTACSTSNLIFSLGAKPAVQRSGAHTLVVTWKVESIGS
jgi:hypothetical protein